MLFFIKSFYYAADGITGFHLKNNVVDEDFYYKKNAQNDIIGIYMAGQKEIARYEYDAWGNCVAKYLQDDGTYAIINDDYSYNDTTIINRFIAFKNPFRFRSYYYDFETNLYYLNSRYYDPEIGRFINADDIDYTDAESGNGLNLYAYCVNNPINLTDENGHAWWDWLISAFQILVGVILIATGVGAGFGATLIASGTLGMVGNALGSTIGSGIGSMANGWGTISTGISLFSYGPLGILAGITCIAIGATTMAFGANEIAYGITGRNFIQEWTGMSDSLYSGLYLGFNILSSIATISGRLGMRHLSTFNGKIKGNAKPYSRITDGYKTVQYDGRGNLYWSIHRTNHNHSWISNPHWHIGAGRDGNHFKSYLRLLIELIFRR